MGGVRERAARRRPLHFPRPDRGRRLFAQSGKGNFDFVANAINIICFAN